MPRDRSQHRRRAVALGGLLFLAVAAAPASGLAQKARFAADAIDAGATTRGGAVEGFQVIHVTSLDDNGPGTLRAALEAKGPSVIVFDVGGRIDLASDLKIHEPFVTIAGQTAPSPGISLWGASLRIRTHDVVVQHIAVRAGPGSTAAVNDNRDGISIDGNPRGGEEHLSYQVRLENVSVSWSVDEVLSLWYPTTRQVTVSHSIVSEALLNAGHPKGPHSMGLLVGTNVQGAEITGNLLASNMFRNPVAGKGASALFANNYIVNPGQNAIHFYAVGSTAPTRASVINNVIEAGPDTKPNLIGVLAPMGKNGRPSNDQIYVAGNHQALGPRARAVVNGDGLSLADQGPVHGETWKLLPAEAVKEDVLTYAGTRPADRDPTDRRLLDEIAAGTERIVSAPPEADMAPPEPTHRVAAAPADLQGLRSWLCREHLAVGGAPSAECSSSR